MATKTLPGKPSPAPMEPRLFLIRGQRVILDSDLARMYGVATGRFNEAFKRNLERFPQDFAFQLTSDEAQNLRSQIATSSLHDVTEEKEQMSDLISQNAISKLELSPVTDSKDGEYGGRRYLPWVFTEHGAVMAANILKGEHAVRMSVFVVRAFVRMREHIAANQAILKRLAEIDKSLLEHDSALRDIYQKLLPLLEPPPEPLPKPKGKLGFQLSG
jgi:hypothetical protein